MCFVMGHAEPDVPHIKIIYSITIIPFIIIGIYVIKYLTTTK